jgi:hypothetical protein
MNQKIVIIALFGISLIGTVGGYFLKNAYKTGICDVSIFCHNLMIKGEAIFYAAVAFLVISFVLWFLPKAFSKWKKFALYATPVVGLIFVFYEGSRGFDLISPSPEFVFKWVSIVYVVVSLLIIFLAARKKKS